MLSRFVKTFVPRRQASFNFMASVTICSDFGAPQNKVCHCFLCFPIYFPWSDGNDAMILVFWMLSLSQLFHSPLSLSSRGSLVVLWFCHNGGVTCTTQLHWTLLCVTIWGHLTLIKVVIVYLDKQPCWWNIVEHLAFGLRHSFRLYWYWVNLKWLLVVPLLIAEITY